MVVVFNYYSCYEHGLVGIIMWIIVSSCYRFYRWKCEGWYCVCACVKWKYDPSKWWYDDVDFIDLGPSFFYMKDYRLWILDLVGLGTLIIYVYEWMKEWSLRIGRPIVGDLLWED